MNLQYAVYFIIAFTFVHGDATDVQRIEIHMKNPLEEHLVRLQKPLVMFFEGKSISRCSWNSNSANEGLLTYTSDPSTRSSSLNIPSVTKDMNTKWTCETENKEKVVFIIRVKGAYAVNVVLVGANVSFDTTSLSVKEYDGIHNYECEVGDTIDIICSNIYENGYVTLQSHDAQGVDITSAQSLKKEKLFFRMLVRDQNVNGSYVDCTYVTLEDEILLIQEFKYRIMFKITNRNPRRSAGGFIVTINDMKLTRLPPGKETEDRYDYKFLSMERLKLTCTKSRELPGAIHGGIIHSTETVLKTDIVNTTQTFTTLIEPVKLDGVVFQCRSETASTRLISEIKFIKEINRDVYILGLNASNILYEYYTGKNEWITHYQYTINPFLNLTCVTTKDRSLQWANREEIIASNQSAEYGTNYINDIFPMSNKTIKTIICKSVKMKTKTQIVTIILHQVLDIPAEGQGSDDEMSFPVYEIIGITIGILFATIFAVFVLYLCKKKINVLKKLHTCLKKDDCQFHSVKKEGVHEYRYIENDYMITNDAYCGRTETRVTQGTLQTGNKEDYYPEIVNTPQRIEMNTAYAVPYKTHHLNKDKVSSSSKDYENVQRDNVINKSNIDYSN